MTKFERLSKLRIQTMELQSKIRKCQLALIKSGELGDSQSRENEAFREAFNHVQSLLTALYKIG